jgi:hypothetical protein
LTYGGVALSNAVTGTGNMVLSASPTLSGTVGGALTFSGTHTLSSAMTYGGVTLSNAVTGTGNMVLSASPTLTGTPIAPTAAITDNSTTIATTAFINGHPQFTAFLTAQQTGVTSATWTKVTLSTPSVDNKSGWNSTNKQYVIPTTGKYRISAQAQFAIGTAVLGNQQLIGIGKNGLVGGGGTILATAIGITTAGATSPGLALAPAIYSLTAADTIELDCNITGTTNAVQGDGYETFMAIEWVGP